MKFENSKIYRKIFENRKVAYPLGIKQTAFLGEVNSPFAPKVKSKISFEGKSEVRVVSETPQYEIKNANYIVCGSADETLFMANDYKLFQSKDGNILIGGE